MLELLSDSSSESSLGHSSSMQRPVAMTISKDKDSQFQGFFEKLAKQRCHFIVVMATVIHSIAKRAKGAQFNPIQCCFESVRIRQESTETDGTGFMLLKAAARIYQEIEFIRKLNL